MREGWEAAILSLRRLGLGIWNSQWLHHLPVQRDGVWTGTDGDEL